MKFHEPKYIEQVPKTWFKEDEEHLNSKQMIIKQGNHKGLRILSIQFHP